MANLPNIVYKTVLVQISQLELKPNQLLIMTFPPHTAEADIRELADAIRPIVPPGYPVLLLRGDVTIAVVEKKNV